jgi:hypothetical protein
MCAGDAAKHGLSRRMSSAQGFLRHLSGNSSPRELDVKKQKQDRTAERGRFSEKQKKDAVLRLLNGTELNALSRELGVTAAVLSEWREKFLTRAETNLTSREPEPADDKVLRLKAMVGALMMKAVLPRSRAPSVLRPQPRGQWQRRAHHPHHQGATALGAHLPQRARPSPGADDAAHSRRLYGAALSPGAARQVRVVDGHRRLRRAPGSVHGAELEAEYFLLKAVVNY